MAALCAFCFHANPSDAKFCNECGNTLRLRPCARCDAVNDVDAKQCHFCGAALHRSSDDADVHALRDRATDADHEAFPDSLQRRADAVIERASQSSSPAMAEQSAFAANVPLSSAGSTSARTGASFAVGAGEGAPEDPDATPKANAPSSVIRALEMGALASARPMVSVTSAPVRRRASRPMIGALIVILAALAASAAIYGPTVKMAWSGMPSLGSLWATVQTHSLNVLARSNDGAAAVQPITMSAPDAVMRDALATDPASRGDVKRTAAPTPNGTDDAARTADSPGTAFARAVKADAPTATPATTASVDAPAADAAKVKIAAPADDDATAANSPARAATAASAPSVVGRSAPSATASAPTAPSLGKSQLTPLTFSAAKPQRSSKTASRRVPSPSAAHANAAERIGTASVDVIAPPPVAPSPTPAPIASCTAGVAALGLCANAP